MLLNFFFSSSQPITTKPLSFSILKKIYLTEEKITHAGNLPEFLARLNREETELILSFLTVPYLAPPLLLEFIANDRYRLLAEKDIQNLISMVFFQQLEYKKNQKSIHLVPVTT